MNKEYIIGTFFMFLVFISSIPGAFALHSDPQNISYFNMSLVKNKITIDARGLNNFTNNSNVFQHGSGSVPYNISGSEKDWGWVNTGAERYMYRTTTMNGQNNWNSNAFTYGCWVNTKSMSTQQYVIDGRVKGPKIALAINNNLGNSKFECTVRIAATYKDAADAGKGANQWNLVVCKWDTKYNSIFTNGIYRASIAASGTLENGTTGNFNIGSNGAGVGLQGNITGCQFFNGNLTNAQIQTWYNYGSPFYQATTTIYLSNRNLSGITNQSAKINWTSTPAGNGTINYGLTNALGTKKTLQTLLTFHNFTLTGLKNFTTYYYNITSCVSGTCKTNGTFSFKTLKGPGYPILSGVLSRNGINWAVINWTSDINSNTSVKYGTTKSLGSISQTNDAVTAHSRSLSGLTEETTYYYNITSCASNLCTINGSFSFKTNSNLTIRATYPANNTQFNTSSRFFYANISTPQTPINCSLKINSVTLQSKTLTSPVTYVNFTQSLSDNTYYYQIICRTSSGYQANGTNRLFYVDTVKPVITTNFINQSIFYKYGSNFTAQFNFTDNNLFSYNISVNGVKQYDAYGLIATFKQVNFTRSPSAFNPNAMNNITVRVADGHTAKRLIDTYLVDSASTLSVASTQYGEVADIPFISLDSNIVGKTIAKGVEVIDETLGTDLLPTSNLQHVTITPIDNSGDFDLEEKVDRYTFSFAPDTISDTYQFRVTSDTKIYIVDSIEYKTYIVTGDKWVDFLLSNEPEEKVSIEKEDDFSAIVTVSGVKNSEVLRFNSIGELNVVTKTYRFFVYANNPTSYTYTMPEITIISPLSIRINKSSQLTSNMILTYNGTQYTSSQLTKTSGTGYDLWTNNYATSPRTSGIKTYTATWNYTLNNSAGVRVSKVVTFTQNITELTMTNCTSSFIKRPGINFTVNDIDTNAPIGNLRTAGDYTIWTSPTLSPTGRNIVKTFNLHTSTNSTGHIFQICINSNKTNYVAWNINYHVVNPGYNVGYSIVTSDSGYTISNRTFSSYPLYLMSSLSSAVINVIDRFGVNLVSYFVKMWLVRPGYNDTLSTTFITDYKGEWQVQYNPLNTYRFDIYNPTMTQLVFTTNRTYITTNPFVIQIPNNENDLQSLQSMTTLSRNVSCNDATNICSFVWHNDIIKRAYFEVYRVNGWGRTRIYNNSVTNHGGSMSYHVIENMTGNSYHAVGYVDTNTNNSFYVVGEADLMKNNAFSSLGDSSTVIFVGFMLVLTIAMLLIDLGPVGLTIGIIGGLVAGTLIGLIPLTWAGIVAITAILAVALYYGKG